MKAMILWELSRRKISLLWWVIGVTALVALTVLSYAAVKDQASQLDQAFGSISSGASSFVGTSDLFSPEGYLNSNLYYITLPILYIILVLNLASSLLGKEENDATLELLLSRPISRGRLLAAKATAGMLSLFLVGGVATLATIICAKIIGMDIAMGGLVLTSVVTVLFAGTFGAISFAMLAASQATRRFATLTAILLSFGGYIITSLAGLVSWLGTPAKFLPYHYFDTEKMLQGTLPLGIVIYIIGAFGIAKLVGYIGFRRRDIG
ncbi:ABC transporter permease subunit [Candidatus Saccharibacteria bacterium]|nr:ABC transporter permease subunit [Candidatus Saccharibacteria bacterium]